MSLTRDWWLPRLTIRTALMLPASGLFGLLAAARRGLYRSGALKTNQLPVPVIVVGNLTVGGSGKTPLVITLVRRLQEQGFRPGVISRGYGRSASAPPGHAVAAVNAVNAVTTVTTVTTVTNRPQAGAPSDTVAVTPDSGPALSGDEPALIARATGAPVFVNRNRFSAGRALLVAHPDTNVIISDDGLQHYALARDMEIAVFDERGAGNGHLLPAGPLRERLSRAVGLTALVHNVSQDYADKSGLHQRFSAMHRMNLVPQPCYRLSDPAQICDVETLATRGATAALAGIGNPARFFAALRSAGLAPAEFPFPDHHVFTRAELAAISQPVLIMTEKDALKCSAFNDERIWVLPVTAQLDAAFFDLILERLRGR